MQMHILNYYISPHSSRLTMAPCISKTYSYQIIKGMNINEVHAKIQQRVQKSGKYQVNKMLRDKGSDIRHKRVLLWNTHAVKYFDVHLIIKTLPLTVYSKCEFDFDSFGRVITEHAHHVKEVFKGQVSVTAGGKHLTNPVPEWVNLKR